MRLCHYSIAWPSYVLLCLPFNFMKVILCFSLLGLSIQGFSQFYNAKLSPLAEYDTLSCSIFPYKSDLFFQNINDHHMDAKSYIWIGMYRRGLIKYDFENHINYYKGYPYGSKFEKGTCNKIEEIDGELWMVGERMFYRYNQSEEVFESFMPDSLDKMEPYQSSIWSVAKIDDTHFLLGSKKGPFILDISNRTIDTIYTIEELRIDGASTDYHVNDLVQDAIDYDIIWGATKRGLFKFSKTDKSITWIDCSLHNDEEWDFEQFERIEQYNDKLYISYDNNNAIFYNIKEDEFGYVSLFRGLINNNEVLPVLYAFKAFGPYLLIGSRGNGPSVIDMRTGKLIQLYIKHPSFYGAGPDNHPNPLMKDYLNTTYLMEIDRNGYLWIGYEREFIIKTKEPLLIVDREFKAKELLPKKVYIDDQRVDNQYSFVDDRCVFSLKKHERNFAFTFGLINASLDSVDYEYQINNNGIWNKRINQEQAIKISNMKGGTNVIQLRAKHSNGIIAERKVQIVVEKLWHEEWVNRFLIGLLLCGVLTVIFVIRRNAKKREEEFKEQLSSLEMMALRSQLNPHFIFNSLNSIKHYALFKSPNETSLYISDFSRLIREFLENSKKNFITLQNEIETLKLYVKMEYKRLEGVFDYKFEIDENLDLENTIIPSMLLQPVIENAIWHGLMHRGKGGLLKLIFKQENDSVLCIIEDNGIGRKNSEEIKKMNQKSFKKSREMEMTTRRMELLNKMNNMSTSMEVIDLENTTSATGTKVIFTLTK